MHRVVVIGNGLAALGALEYLTSDIPDPSSILWIRSNQLPRCSTLSTAVVAPMGIKRGISPLGDLLVDAYESTKSFCVDEDPQGVSFAKRFHIAVTPEQVEALKRRYGEVESIAFRGRQFTGICEEALIFQPDPFLDWFEKRMLDRGVSMESATVLGIEEVAEKVIISDGEKKYHSNYAIMATGAYDHLFPINATIKKKVSVIPGHFLTWTDQFYGDETWSLTVGQANIIYRAQTNELLLGGTTEKDGVMACRFDQFEKFRELTASVFVLPDFEQAQFKTGLRSKGPKRLPICEWTSPRQLRLGHFYKNGYSLYHPMGKKAAQMITRLL
jgi:hypothetical protein